jgi:hypothetical protein
VDPRVRSCGWGRPADSSNNDDGEGEEDTQGGKKVTRNRKGTQDVKGKGKGLGMGHCKGKGTVQQTPRGDDISRAVALLLQKETYEPDSDTEG